MTSSGKSCKALTKLSKPCAGHVLPGGDYCLFHDPTRAAERRARHGRKLQIAIYQTDVSPIQIDNASDVLALVVRAINDTLLLENSNNRNRTIGSLASSAIECLKIGELEQRLAALEMLIKVDRCAIPDDL